MVDALVARVRAREALEQQLEQLSRGVTAAAPAAAQPPRALQAELKGWVEGEAARRRHRLFTAELVRGEVPLTLILTRTLTLTLTPPQTLILSLTLD